MKILFGLYYGSVKGEFREQLTRLVILALDCIKALFGLF
jgi:hypothetical protein